MIELDVNSNSTIYLRKVYPFRGSMEDRKLLLYSMVG